MLPAGMEQQNEGWSLHGQPSRLGTLIVDSKPTRHAEDVLAEPQLLAQDLEF